jgi:hypothetical protein
MTAELRYVDHKAYKCVYSLVWMRIVVGNGSGSVGTNVITIILPATLDCLLNAVVISSI